MKSRIKFLRSGITLTAVGLAIRTAAMLFGAFISKAVGAEGMGLYTVIMTVYSFALTFASSGISLTVTRHIAGAIGEGREDEIGKILRSSFLYSLFFGVASTLFLFFGADFIGAKILFDKRSVLALKILSASLVPAALLSVISGYFVGVRRIGFNAAVQVFAQVIKITLTLFLVTRLSSHGIVMSVLALCIGMSLTEILSLALILVEFLIDRHRHAKEPKVKGGSALPEVARSALPLAVSAYARSVLTTIEHILIPRRLMDRGEEGGEAYSHYGTLHGMALPLVLYPMSPLTSFSGLLVPEFAEDIAARNRERMERVASEAMNTTLIYSALTAVFLFFFSEELGYIVYDSYDAGRHIAMLAPIVPIMYLDHVTDGILKGVGEQVYSMWVNITDSLLSVILVYFLIPAMGITGYALVIIIMEGYNFLLSVLKLRRRVKFKIEYFISIVLPAVCAYVGVLLANEFFVFNGSTASGGWLTAKIFFAVCIFVFAYVLARLVLKRSLNKTTNKQVKRC